MTKTDLIVSIDKPQFIEKKKQCSLIRFLIIFFLYLSFVSLIAYLTVRTYWPLFMILVGLITTVFLFYSYYELTEKYIYFRRYEKLLKEIKKSNPKEIKVYIESLGKLTMYKKIEVQKVEAIENETNIKRTIYILSPFLSSLTPGNFTVKLYQNIIIKANFTDE